MFEWTPATVAQWLVIAVAAIYLVGSNLRGRRRHNR
jgi:hypothetical protein